jgi:sulfate adenylyltransferase
VSDTTTAFEALGVEDSARLDQALLGLIEAAVLPGPDEVTYLDEEGTPVARRAMGRLTALLPLSWPTPARSFGAIAVPELNRLPAAALPADVTVLLPLGGVRPDDLRGQVWAAAWRSAATAAGAEVVSVPVLPGEAHEMSGALAAAYGNGEVAELPTATQPLGAGRAVLLSGLSGSGKSTIARALVERLGGLSPQRSVTLLDGDVVRTHLSRGLGFSREDRDVNVRRIGWVAAEIAKHGGLCVCAPIAPYDDTRQWVRATVDAAAGPGAFLLVWVSTPIEVCEQRDVKGLYARARAGELTGFTGIDDPYESPADAELVIDTSVVALDQAVEMILARL